MYKINPDLNHEKVKNMADDINELLENTQADEAPGRKKKVAPNTKTSTAEKRSNEGTAIKNKIMAIVQSFEIVDSEREAQKEIKEDLKETHGIEPKVAAMAAKYLHDPEKRKKAEETDEQLQALLLKIG